jgi:autophagy-related protein 2
MIYDDLPSNMDYLDESFSAAAGLRELNDDDLLDFENDSVAALSQGPNNVETINMLEPVEITEDYFETLPPESSDVK